MSFEVMVTLARDKRVFGEITFRTTTFGYLVKGWDILQDGCFHIMDSANQSLHLSTLRSAGEFRVGRLDKWVGGAFGFLVGELEKRLELTIRLRDSFCKMRKAIGEKP